MNTLDAIQVFTVGHSTHELGAFFSLLSQHRITAVADVRSRPYSRLSHFNSEELAAALNAHGIEYVFMGREFGARRDEPECYVEGQARYERIAELPAFRQGLERIAGGLEQHRIALMCAEKEPLDCHRTILVSRELQKHGLQVWHILSDGSLESHAESENRLIEMMGVAPGLFDQDVDHAEIARRAYEARGLEIAYRQEQGVAH
jgi:uncharacterized protein (DUF488 family)